MRITLAARSPCHHSLLIWLQRYCASSAREGHRKPDRRGLKIQKVRTDANTRAQTPSRIHRMRTKHLFRAHRERNVHMKKQQTRLLPFSGVEGSTTGARRGDAAQDVCSLAEFHPALAQIEDNREAVALDAHSLILTAWPVVMHSSKRTVTQHTAPTNCEHVLALAISFRAPRHGRMRTLTQPRNTAPQGAQMRKTIHHCSTECTVHHRVALSQTLCRARHLMEC